MLSSSSFNSPLLHSLRHIEIFNINMISIFVYHNHWFDANAGGQKIPDGIHKVVSPAWFRITPYRYFIYLYLCIKIYYKLKNTLNTEGWGYIPSLQTSYYFRFFHEHLTLKMPIIVTRNYQVQIIYNEFIRYCLP